MPFSDLMQRIADLKQQEVDIRYLLKLPGASEATRGVLVARLQEVREQRLQIESSSFPKEHTCHERLPRSKG